MYDKLLAISIRYVCMNTYIAAMSECARFKMNVEKDISAYYMYDSEQIQKLQHIQKLQKYKH